LTGHGATIDTTTVTGNRVSRIFAALEEFECDSIVERKPQVWHQQEQVDETAGSLVK